MGFELLARNARDRREQYRALREESRESAETALRLALGEALDSVTATPYTGTPSQLTRLRMAEDFVDRDRVTQQAATMARSRAARGVALQQTVNRFEVEIHKKLALAFACLVFTLMGPPLALRFPRSGVGFVVTASSVIFSVYWVGLILGESLAERRVASPAVTMWLSNVIFLVVGIAPAFGDEPHGRQPARWRARPGRALQEGRTSRARRGERVIRTLDRMVLGTFFRLFILVAVAVPPLFILGDFTEQADSYLDRGLTRAEILRGLPLQAAGVPLVLPADRGARGDGLHDLQHDAPPRDRSGQGGGDLVLPDHGARSSSTGVFLMGAAFGLAELVPRGNARSP